MEREEIMISSAVNRNWDIHFYNRVWSFAGKSGFRNKTPSCGGLGRRQALLVKPVPAFFFFIKIHLKSHFSETVQIWRCKIAENLINVLQYCTVQYNTVQYSIVQYKVLPDKHKEYTYEFQGTDLKYSCS